MSYLLASIVCSTLILVIFRWMQNTTAVTRHAIVVGYFVSAITGAVFFRIDWNALGINWFWLAAIEGVIFYFVFRLMALTAQNNGVTVAGIATKMSVVIPTMIGVMVLGESVNAYKILGVCAGLLSVFLVAGSRIDIKNWTLPVLVFVSTGLIDASFKLFQVWGLTTQLFPVFIVTIFGFAFVTSAVHHILLTDRLIGGASVISGVMPGLCNFGTVYFLMSALAGSTWESSIIYPLNHVGVVVASTIVGIFCFSERPSASVKIGFVLALFSIALLYWSSVVTIQI